MWSPMSRNYLEAPHEPFVGIPLDSEIGALSPTPSDARNRSHFLHDIASCLDFSHHAVSHWTVGPSGSQSVWQVWAATQCSGMASYIILSIVDLSRIKSFAFYNGESTSWRGSQRPPCSRRTSTQRTCRRSRKLTSNCIDR